MAATERHTPKDASGVYPLPGYYNAARDRHDVQEGADGAPSVRVPDGADEALGSRSDALPDGADVATDPASAVALLRTIALECQAMRVALESAL